MMQNIIKRLLRILAKSVLNKRKPKVVAITGSVGKTTTKEAIVKVLENNFKIRSSQKNYNNEIGVPLAILGYQINYSKNKGFQFSGIIYYWLKARFFDKDYPEILVLELGADKPGDIKYFCDFIPITVGVLTEIGVSHLENFKTRQNLATEKGFLLRNVSKNGMAVYNYDNKLVREVGEKISVSKISYGLDTKAEMRATDIINKIEVNETIQKINGVNFKLNYLGKVLPVRLEKSIGKGSVYSILAALSVGVYFDLNLIEMIENLKSFVSCSGRMRVLRGINGSVIIDDSYNSAPASLDLALNLVDEIKARRKIIILGDMLELGEEEIRSHQKIGRKVREIHPNYFIAIGKRMELAVDNYLKENYNKENLMVFDNSEEAKELLRDLVGLGDLVLVKGSRGMKMEKIVSVLKEK